MVVDLFHNQPANDGERIWRDALRAGLPLTPKLRASEWLERNFVIPDGLSTEPGPLRLVRAPHAILPTDLFCEGEVDQVAVGFSAQLSKTQVVCLGSMAFISLHLRLPLGYMMPTRDKMDENTEEKIEPTLRACAGGERAIRSAKLARIRFAGGNTQFHYGGNSPTAIKGSSIPCFIVDERDDDNMHEESLTKADARGNAFPARMRRMLQSSTYLDWGHGLHAEALTSQVYRYFVPCPHCGTYQELLFRGPNESGVVWQKPDKGDTWRSERAITLAKRTAYYRCCNLACVQSDAGGRIEQRHKQWMMAMGAWCARDPYDTGGDIEHVEVADTDRLLATRSMTVDELSGAMLARRTYDQMRDEACADDPAQHGVLVAGGQGLPRRVAFEMGSVYSLFMEFGELAGRWVRAAGRMDRTLAGHYFGQPHREKGTRLEPSMVAKLCRPLEQGGYPVGFAPPWAVALSLTADLQRDRAVVELRAWGPRGDRSGLVWAGEIPCADGGQLVELDPLYNLKIPIWHRPDQPWLPVIAAAVDSGDGGRTDEVYTWQFRWNLFRLRTGGPMVAAWPIKGVPDAWHRPVRTERQRMATANARQSRPGRAAALAALGEFDLLHVSRPFYIARLFGKIRAAAGVADTEGASVATRGDGPDAAADAGDAIGVPAGEAWVYPAPWGESGGDDPVVALCPGASRMPLAEYGRQVCAAEKRVDRDAKGRSGRSRPVWYVPDHRDDHALDASRYAIAVMDALDVGNMLTRPDMRTGRGPGPPGGGANVGSGSGPSGPSGPGGAGHGGGASPLRAVAERAARSASRAGPRRAGPR